MKITYKDLETSHNQKIYSVQNFCKDLVAKGITGKLEIYPNTNQDGDGLPDVIYPSISRAANYANTSYLQKGVHYAQWFPILKKDM